MTNEYYSADQVFLSDALIGSMTAWRNADADLIAAEVVASDEFINGALIEPIGYATGIGKADTYLPKYRTMFYSPGSWIETNYFQTGRRLFPAFGSGLAGTSTCTTTNPGAYYQHVITLRNSQTPLSSGRLLARDNETNGEDEFISMLGMLPKTYHVECTEQSFIASQTMGWQVAYTSITDTDVVEPSALTDVPYDWSNVTFPTFSFNTGGGAENIEADILGVGIDIINNCRFTALDSTGYYTKGKMAGFQDIAVTLNIVPYGRNPFEVKRTKLESMTTDIAFTAKFTRSTNDYVQFAFTKMYLDPFEIVPGTAANWFEGYMVRLHLLSTGALTITIQDAYDDSYYETS